MTTVAFPLRSLEDGSRGPRPNYKPGDLVTTSAGYPILYEILAIVHEGALRVRGLNWAAGYSALVSSADVRPVSHLLRE